ncbi:MULTISPECIES: hypothetical protein [Mesorhizobium]|uniref:Uncharacterized protein n=1 Tax=Mesorhizobium denitrificans TaxID=2294114 RepID=A0A371X246_9HYPH|nr:MULTISPECIES: hypothetical protein [Mesorhizobium]RFC63279.1 hypothetical protein DY251_20735 [Mesorhizobium denitrificans]
MINATITKADSALLAEVAKGKMSGIEPRDTLRLLLLLQDRGLITMCVKGWALTSDGKQMLDAIRR